MFKILPYFLLNLLFLFKLIFNKSFLINFFFPRKENNLISFFTSQKYILKKNNKILFSVRNMGGSTKSRGKSFYQKEKKTIKWIDNFKKNSLLIDIGANIEFTFYAAKYNHKVISIEPDSLNYALLNLNIFDNKLNNQIHLTH